MIYTDCFCYTSKAGSEKSKKKKESLLGFIVCYLMSWFHELIMSSCEFSELLQKKLDTINFPMF